ncbi:MAG: glycosyltransferase family 4 protein, partial [Phycisphaeraceae bacterium]
RRYAELCRDIARGESFDVLHAHDWMSFPAGLAAAGATGKPLVVHVHSTEFDRAGEAIDERIYDIERRGMHAAVRVIAVSHMTASIIEHRYGVPRSRIAIVHNGIDPTPPATTGEAGPTTVRLADDERLVLFLGRLTMQKGPQYFVEAAVRVLEKNPNVKFIMAGDGDRADELVDLAARRGIGHRLLFAGFLRGEDVDRVFQTADVYVMPSVSEPVGLAALEAIRSDVPVIVSRNSGVAEVVKHALKVDPWNIEDLADKILAVLRHAPLASSLRRNAEIELRTLTWPDAARQCIDVYEQAAQTV